LIQTLEHSFAASDQRPRHLYGFPQGWFLQNRVTIAYMDQMAIDSLDQTNCIVRMADISAWSREIETEYSRFRPYTWVAAIASPNFRMAILSSAEHQARISETIVACGLERYHLQHGRYPETLDALTPQFVAKLPIDVVNGGRLQYFRADDGEFILYSIGWNQLDDRGAVARRDGAARDWEGDWVWASATQ
jgi:hypothetical protein